MIQLTRQRTAAIPARFRGADRLTHERELLEARRDHIASGNASFTFLKSSMWGPSKDLLDAESNAKCGYCEASARANAHCDVEHIRPKKKYWWLALCYDNYVLACQICNQTHKGDKYPTAAAALVEPAITGTANAALINGLLNTFAPDPLNDDATLTLSAYSAALRAEDPDLINPYHEDPERFFTWEADSVLGEVEIKPAIAAGRDHDRAESTIDILGLNREKLKQLRWESYQLLDALCKLIPLLPVPLPPDADKSVRDALEAKSSFAAMHRHLVRKTHNLPF